MPTLLSISPVTTLCLEPIYGFYDPPYALSAANGLFAPVTAAPPDPVDTGKGGPTTPTSAAAGQIPNPSTATKTTPLTLTPTPVYIPPNSQTNDPPQDPPTNAAAPTQPSVVGNDLPPSQHPSSVSQDPPPPPKNAPPSQITLAGSTFTANSESAFVVGTQTLSVNGQAITISGTVFSLAPNNAVATASPTPSDPISKIVVDGQTLIAGGVAVTISGTVISLISGGDSVVVGGKTEPVSVIAGTGTTVGLGGIIVSIGGFGGKPNEAGGSASTSTSTTSTIEFNGLVFTGEASRGNGNIWFIVALNFRLSITLLWMH
jgi:hypothetical protein